MDYFSNCTCTIEAKKCYFELAFLHHPDKGGDTAIFQEINKQYREFLTTNKNSTSENYNHFEYSSFADFFNDPQFIEIIAEFEKKTGITITEIKQTVTIIDKFLKLFKP